MISTGSPMEVRVRQKEKNSGNETTILQVTPLFILQQSTNHKRYPFQLLSIQKFWEISMFDESGQDKDIMLLLCILTLLLVLLKLCIVTGLFHVDDGLQGRQKDS